MSRTGEDLWGSLLKAGLVEGQPPATDTIESPWYVKAILAFSGWLAAIFLLGFRGCGITIHYRKRVRFLSHRRGDDGCRLCGLAYPQK